MSRTVTVSLPQLPGRSYDVVVGAGVLGRLGQAAAVMGVRRCAVIAQASVGAVAEAVSESLTTEGVDVIRFDMAAGERAKSWATVGRLLEAMATAGLHRDSLVVGVGGGVVTDTAGFCAATFLRGVRWIACATTLLAALDAAIGGKTGVNLKAGKNLAGAFWQPAAAFVDTTTFSTLPVREVHNGLAEAAKYGFIRDVAILEVMQRWSHKDVTDLMQRVPDELEDVICRGAAVKADIVGKDEREGGVRATLNYGHTLGHALELASGYRFAHGEAISVGMVFAAKLACRCGLVDPEVVALHLDVLGRLGLPTTARKEDMAAALPLMERDKKATAAGLRFVLLDGLGQATVVDDVPTAMVEAAVADVSLG